MGASNLLGIPGGQVKSSSYIRLSTIGALGSVGTCIPRWSFLVDRKGTAITWNQSPTFGDSFTIGEPGLYLMAYCSTRAASSALPAGFSLNATLLQTAASITTLTGTAQCINFWNSAISTWTTGTGWVWANTGDVIRPHSDGNDITGDARSSFSIVKVL